MSDPQVVITRKHKKLHKFWHLFAFTATGGTSAPVTAIKAATNAAYNAETVKLAEERPQQSTYSDRFNQFADMRRRVSVQARQELGLTGIPRGKLSRDQRRALDARKREIRGHA